MGFRITYGDICKMEVDAIVNSLGINSRAKGMVCKSICASANSPSFNEVIENNTHGHVFDLHICEGGDLKAPHIINIVSPFKRYDDKDLSKLKRAYVLVIEKAIDLGYKSIAIPFLGTGANGYSNLDTYNAAAFIGEKYIDNEDIDIILALYFPIEARKIVLSDTKESLNILFGSEPEYDSASDFLAPENDEALKNFCGFERVIKEASVYMPEKIRNSIKLNKLFNLMKQSEMYIPDGDITCPMDFIDDYVTHNGIRKSYLFVHFLGKDDCSKARRGKKTLTKCDIYRASIALGFNRTIFLQLMGFAGYSFSSSLEEDVWFYNYYMKNELEPDLPHFYDKYEDEIDILDKIYKD